SALPLQLSDRAAAGAYALLHPAAAHSDGTQLAAVVAELDLELTYPRYFDDSPIDLKNPVHVEAPKGTSVRVSIRPRLRARKGALLIAGEEVFLRAQADGRLEGQFVVRKDGALDVRLQAEDGHWLTDPTRRTLRAVSDEAPLVE